MLSVMCTCVYCFRIHSNFRQNPSTPPEMNYVRVCVCVCILRNRFFLLLTHPNIMHTSTDCFINLNHLHEVCDSLAHPRIQVINSQKLCTRQQPHLGSSPQQPKSASTLGALFRGAKLCQLGCASRGQVQRSCTRASTKNFAASAPIAFGLDAVSWVCVSVNTLTSCAHMGSNDECSPNESRLGAPVQHRATHAGGLAARSAPADDLSVPHNFICAAWTGN